MGAHANPRRPGAGTLTGTVAASSIWSQVSMRVGPRACAIVGVGVLCVAGWLPLRLDAQRGGMFQGSADDPGHCIHHRTRRNVIEDLNKKLQDGSAGLRFDGRSGYLQSAIDALKLPVDSQLLVFSKASLQRQAHQPVESASAVLQRPRRAGVGARRRPARGCRTRRAGGRRLLFAGTAAGRAAGLQARVQVPCLPHDRRHVGRSRSAHVQHDARHGRPAGQDGSDGSAQPARRSAGAGGSSREAVERRRIVATEAPALEGHPGGGIASVEGLFDPDGFRAASSDIAALLTFSHQTQMINLLTRASWEARAADPALHPGVLAAPGQMQLVEMVTSAVAEEVVDYMLFVDEAPLPNPVDRRVRFCRADVRERTARPPGTVALRARSETAADEVSVQLPDLLTSFRRAAAAGERADLPADVAGARRRGP